MCASKCIKGESVIYRVRPHKTAASELPCVRTCTFVAAGGYEGGGRALRGELNYGAALAGVMGESLGLPIVSRTVRYNIHPKRTISLINIDNASGEGRRDRCRAT